MDLANTVKNGGVEYIEIDDTQIALNSENLLITMNGKDGFAFAGEGEIGVVLDTHITQELKRRRICKRGIIKSSKYEATKVLKF